MIGTYINLSLPAGSDTMADVVSKTATCLGQLRDSIADKATPAGLDINAALALGGNQITGCGGVTLADGNNPTAAGSIYYHNGEFYLVDSTGTIQLTAAGSLDVASVGGIGGDYGGSSPALVSYNTASTVYRMYANTTGPVWADVAAKGVILNGAAGSLRQLCAATFAGSHDVTWPTALPARQQAMTMDDTGQLAFKAGSLYVGTQRFAAGGTYTPTTGVTRVEVEAVGGGGGGGGVSTGAVVGGGGGAAGSYGFWSIGDGTSLITGGTVTIGAAGAGGASTGATGGTGGDTSVVVNGTTYTAGGGTGGGGVSTSTGYGAGGTEGSITGTNLVHSNSQTGNDGGGYYNSTAGSWAMGGAGGNSPFGFGGSSVFVFGGGSPLSKAGVSGNGNGAGGGGAAFDHGSAGTAQAGGNGTAGLVLIHEFI